MQFCFLGAEELNRLPKHTKESIMKEIDEIVKIELTRETSQANYSSVLNDKGKQALETFNACKIHKAQNIMRKELEKGNTILDGLKMLIDTEENEIFVMQPEYSKFPLHTIPNFSLENCLNRKKKIAAKYKGLKLELVEKMLLEKASKNEEKITDVNKPEEKENIAPTQIPYTYDSHLSNFSDLIKAINLFDQLKRKKRTSINKISCRDIKKFKPQAQSLKKFRLYSSISKDILSLNFQKNKFRNHQPTPRVARWMSQKKVKEIYKHDPQYRNLGKSAFNQLAFRHQMAPVIPLMDIQDFMNRYGFSYTYNPQEKKEVEKVGFVAATHDKKGEPVKGYIFMAYDCKTKKVFHAFFQEHLKGISVIGETEKAFAELSDIPKEEEPWKVVGGKFVYDVLSNEKTIQIKFNEKSVSIVPIH